MHVERIPCDLCGGETASEVLRQPDLTHHITEELFSVVRCDHCGLCFLNPRPAPDEIGRYYPPQYFPRHERASPRSAERAAKRFSNRIKRWIMEDYYDYPAKPADGVCRTLRKCLLWPEVLRRRWRGRDILPWVGEGRLLDVGCGPGTNLAVWQAQGWRVSGVEMSEVAAALARERVGDRVHLGTLENAPFEPGTFDVIVFSHSLEHHFSPSRALATAKRLLRPGGLLVIAVPNAGGWEARVFGRFWFPWELPRHLYHFERSSMAELLRRAGFRVARLRTGVGTLYFMASLDRVWQDRFHRAPPLRRIVEKLVARPFCLAAGHLGQGTEMTVYAVKSEAPS